MNVTGGISTSQPVNAHIISLCQQLKVEMQQSLNLNQPFVMFKPISFTQQVVAGIKYQVMIQISPIQIIQVTIWEQPWLNRFKMTHISYV